MFIVTKKINGEKETIYSVRSNIGFLGDEIVEFLIYDYGWEWVLASCHKPIDKQ